MKQRGIATSIRYLVLALTIWCYAFAAFAADIESEKYTLLDGTAEAVLGAAWPTAKYASYEFKNIRYSSGVAELTYRIHANSGWINAKLWVDFVLAIDLATHNIRDMRFGDYSSNAVFPPGSTAKLMMQMANERY